MQVSIEMPQGCTGSVRNPTAEKIVGVTYDLYRKQASQQTYELDNWLRASRQSS
jgi:hypothetical protein